MKEALLWFILLFISLYMLAPYLITRAAGIGVFRKGSRPGQVALTFDDGPDPSYTPRLLDLLARHDIKATFFILGSKAEKHPELIQRIHREGHQIGIHNYDHVTNWLMTPWRVSRKQVDRSADIVEQLTGERPLYYRPPWGIMNIGDFFLKDRYEIVLWTLMARDWRSHIGAERLKARLLKGATHGFVILLHDSGETFGAGEDAPEQMLAALQDVIPELEQRGLSFVRVDAMDPPARLAGRLALGFPKRMVVALWMQWERLFLKMFHVQAVDEENPLLKVRLKKYTGQPIVLEDGAEVRKGDQVIELHLDNDTLFQMGASAKSSLHVAIHMIRGMEQLLPKVTKLMESDPAYRDVKALCGITMIHRGTRQLGFTVFDLPKGIFAVTTRLYLRFLMSVIHPRGKDRLKTNADKLVPKLIVMSKHELKNRYAM